MKLFVVHMIICCEMLFLCVDVLMMFYSNLKQSKLRIHLQVEPEDLKIADLKSNFSFLIIPSYYHRRSLREISLTSN